MRKSMTSFISHFFYRCWLLFYLTRIYCLSLFIVYFFSVVTPPSVRSHPHVFMDTKVEFEFGPSGMKGIWVDWLFDEIFSATVKMDFDSDKDNQFSPSEVKEIKESAFANLKNFDYFTYITVGAQTTSAKTVTSFTAKLKKNRLHYRFFIPFVLQSKKKEASVIVSVYDKTFYCDIGMDPKKGVLIKGAEHHSTQYLVQKDYENEITYNNAYQTAAREGVTYSGKTHPFEVILGFKRKK